MSKIKKKNPIFTYSHPLKLNVHKRKALIENNIEELLSNHYLNTNYHDFIKLDPYSGAKPFGFMPKIIKSWKQHFTYSTFRSQVRDAVENILYDKGFRVECIPYNMLSESQVKAVEHNLYLPDACDYFKTVFKSENLSLTKHCILVLDALDILSEKFEHILEGLFDKSMRFEMEWAIIDKENWIMISTSPDGTTILTNGLTFVLTNRAMLTLLTFVLTLPWELELKKLL